MVYLKIEELVKAELQEVIFCKDIICRRKLL